MQGVIWILSNIAELGKPCSRKMQTCLFIVMKEDTLNIYMIYTDFFFKSLYLFNSLSSLYDMYISIYIYTHTILLNTNFRFRVATLFGWLTSWAMKSPAWVEDHVPLSLRLKLRYPKKRIMIYIQWFTVSSFSPYFPCFKTAIIWYNSGGIPIFRSKWTWLVISPVYSNNVSFNPDSWC